MSHYSVYDLVEKYAESQWRRRPACRSRCSDVGLRRRRLNENVFLSRDSLRLVSIRKALQLGVTLFSNLYFSFSRHPSSCKTVLLLLLSSSFSPCESTRCTIILCTTIIQLFSNVVGLRISRPPRPGIVEFTHRYNVATSPVRSPLYIFHHNKQQYKSFIIPTFVIRRPFAFDYYYAHACSLIGHSDGSRNVS